MVVLSQITHWGFGASWQDGVKYVFKAAVGART